jgi:hypothetical protein
MKIVWVDKDKHDVNKIKFGCQLWGKCIEADFAKDTDDLSGYDVAIMSFCGGTYDIPTNIKRRYPNMKIIGCLDYNSWELHEVLGICDGNTGLVDIDIFICPKPLCDWLRVIYQKPVIEAYRPYDPNDFEYTPYDKREKIILVSEHTKTKQVFSEKMVAKRILERIPNGNEYKIVIKDTCRGDHPYPTGKLEHPTLTSRFGLNFQRYDKWNPAPIPMISIDHYPAALFGGFHAANAFYGTPTLGIDTSAACVQAFPELQSEPYDLVSMLIRGYGY